MSVNGSTAVLYYKLYYNGYITPSSQRVTDICYKTLLTLNGNIGIFMC